MTRESQRLLDQLKRARTGLKSRVQPTATRPTQEKPAPTLDALFEKAASGALPAPKSVLFVRSDSYGDLILFAPALARLKSLWPATRIGLLLKEIHRDIIPLLPAGVDYLTTTANPYRETAAEFKEVSALGHQIGDFSPEVLVAVGYEKSWLHALAATAAPASRRLSLGPAVFDEPTRSFLDSAGTLMKPEELFPEGVAVDRDSHELEKNRRLIEHLSRTRIEALAPDLSLPASAATEARAALAKMGLKPDRYLVCNPAGIANVAVKSWSPENFAEVLSWLMGRSSMRVLLVAHVREETVIRNVLARLPAQRIEPAVWLGETGQMPLLAGLLADARFYLGSDTSTAHLAEAVQTPVVGLYGGGTWPRFTPSLPTSIAFVHPLPCFGCGWDCHFVDAPCLKLVRPADVIAQLPRYLEKSGRIQPAGDRVILLQRLPEEQLVSIRRSRDLFQEIQSDRSSRLVQILRLTDEVKARETTLTDLDRSKMELLHRLRAAEKDLPALRSEIEQLSDKLRATELDSANRLQQIKTLTTNVLTAREEAAGLRKQLETLDGLQQTEKKLAEDQIHKLNRLANEARVAAEEEVSKSAALAQEQIVSASKVHMLERQVLLLKTELESEKEQAGALMPLIDTLRRQQAAAHEQFHQEIILKQQSLGALQEEHDRLLRSLRELEENQQNLTAQLEAKTRDLTAAELDRKELQQAHATEQVQMAERLRMADNEILQLKEASAALHVELEAKTSELHSRTEALAQMETETHRLHRQREYMQAILERNAKRQHDDNVAIDSLHLRLSEATNLLEANLSARNELLAAHEQSQSAMAEEKSRLEAALEDVRAAFAKQTEQLQAAELQRVELERSLADSFASAHQAEAALAVSREHVEQLQAELAAARSNHADFQARAEETLDTLQGELRDRNDQLARELAEFEATQKAFQSFRAEAAQFADNLNAELSATNVLLEEERRQAQSVSTHLGQLQATLLERESTLAECQATLARRDMSITDLVAAQARLEKSFHDVQTELQRECDRLKAALAEKTQDALLLQTRVHDLEIATAALQDSLASTRKTLAEEQSIASAHRRSAMQLTRRIRQLQIQPIPVQNPSHVAL